MKISKKLYRCTKCGHTEYHKTNHYGQTYSYMTYSMCPNCKPSDKFHYDVTIWEYMGKPPEGTKIPENWKKATIVIKK